MIAGKHIYEELVNAVKKQSEAHRVLDCGINERCLGLHTSAGTGLAFVPGDAWEQARRIGPARLADELRGRALSNIVPHYVESDSLRTVFALAAINALLINRGEPDVDVWKQDLGGTQRLGLIGDLRPFVNRIGFAGTEQILFELKPLPGAHRPEEAGEFLPGCDVVFMTSAVFSNKTLHHYLAHINSGARAFIFGHSTPLADCLLDVFTLCSNEVVDVQGAFQSLWQGKGIRQLKPFMRKVIRMSKKKNG